MGGLNSVATELDRQDTNAAIHWYQSPPENNKTQQEMAASLLCWLRVYTSAREEKPVHKHRHRHNINKVAIFPCMLYFMDAIQADRSTARINKFVKKHENETVIFVAGLSGHAIVLLKEPKVSPNPNLWFVLDSNYPFGDPDPVGGHRYKQDIYRFLKAALQSTGVCSFKNVPVVSLRQGTLESAFSSSLSVRTYGACLLCSLATTCFIALIRPVVNGDFCDIWKTVLLHCQTGAGEATVWRFVISTLRILRTLIESRYSPVLLCTPPGVLLTEGKALDGEVLLKTLRQRKDQHLLEKQWLSNAENCEPDDEHLIVFTDEFGVNTGFDFDLARWDIRAQVRAFMGTVKENIVCVLLFSKGETCPIQGYKNELVQFEQIANEERATLQQEKNDLERVVQQTQHELKNLRDTTTEERDVNALLKRNIFTLVQTVTDERNRLKAELEDVMKTLLPRMHADGQGMNEAQNKKLTEEITKLTEERDLLKVSKFKLMQTFTEDRNKLTAEIGALTGGVLPRMQGLYATTQHVNEAQNKHIQSLEHELNTRSHAAAKLTEEKNLLELQNKEAVQLTLTLTHERDRLKAKIDNALSTMQRAVAECQQVNEAQKMQNEELRRHIESLGRDGPMEAMEMQHWLNEYQRRSEILIADYRVIVDDQDRTITRNHATIEALESNMRDFESTRVACNERIHVIHAQLNSCQDKLKGQPDYQRKEFEHNAVMENINADLMGFRASFEDDKKVIAEYKHLNEQLTENLRKIITETDVLRKEMQTKHDTLHSEYTTLRTKHKNLQHTINAVYTATKNFRAPQNPRQPSSSAQKRPFRGQRRGVPL